MARISKFCNPSDEVVIAPEYCPEAVEAYCRDGNVGDRAGRTMKVKKHLSSVGWTFYYVLIKAGKKKELKYCSPTGKVFHTLFTACKSCVVERSPNVDVPSKKQLQVPPQMIPKRGIKRKSENSSVSCTQKTPRTTMCKKALTSNPSLVSSQATGKQEDNSEHVSSNVGVAFDDIFAMSEFLLGEQELVEETEFIDQKSTWWIDELLNI